MAREMRVTTSGDYGTIEVGKFSNGNTIIEAKLRTNNPDIVDNVRFVLLPGTISDRGHHGAAEDLLAALTAVLGG